MNRRVEQLLGPFAVWRVCPHGPDDACACRKPRPGLVLAAARQLGLPPQRIALIGDIGADMEAATAAGAAALLVPTAATRSEEVAAAPTVCTDLVTAVRHLLGSSAPPSTDTRGGEARS